MAIKAILSIVLFVATYLLLIALAIGITIVFGYAGIMLIVFKPMFLTLMLGFALMGVGVLIILFLFKFVTKKHTIDRSHLMEITDEDEPELFRVISEVVDEVQTRFPKKVYLSYDVNAAVFYNSSFWSMFFPIRKNLQIGVGLINAVTTSELKAILAHEFGHFSQRSMKVGSYVYNVNHVIYNLLFENDSYNSLLTSWTNASKYFHITAEVAVKIIQGIQWVLKKVYTVVNLNYMALSREMEFHADEVAANVTGPQPLISSLLRLDLADNSFKTVLSYYSERIEQCIKTNNVYGQYGWHMNFMGSEYNLPIQNGLPQVSKEDLSRFNKSKLTIKNQWSSHPSTEERIEHLQRWDVSSKDIDNSLASNLLKDKDAVQEKFTEFLFGSIEYKNTPVVAAADAFIQEYLENHKEISFSKIYNGYYDHKNIAIVDIESLEICNFTATAKSSSTLFSADAVDMVYSANSLESDIEYLKQIAKGDTALKTYDYDGVRYSVDDCSSLIVDLERELDMLRKKIADHDKEIVSYFLSVGRQQGTEDELLKMHKDFYTLLNSYERRNELYGKLVESTSFIQETTPFDTIATNLVDLQQHEKKLKEEMHLLLQDPLHLAQITNEIRESFEKYLSQEWIYFNKPNYNNDALDVLFGALRNYHTVITHTCFKYKKSLLDYQAGLESNVLLAEAV